jgi:hypothetical protein
MAFLPALAAAGKVGAAAGAAGAAATGGALATGLSAGTILGTKAATTGLLSTMGGGLNALGGMASVLPASASLTAAAPTLAAPGIFSAAAPALGGLKTLAGPGLFKTMGMSPLGGLAGTTGVVPSVTGAVQALPAAATAASPTAGLFNTMGMSPLGGLQSLTPSATVASQSAALQAAKGNIIGAGTQAQMNAARQLAMDAAKQQAIGGGTTQTINTALNKAAADANIANINAGVQNAIGTPTAPTAVTTGPASYTPASPIIKGQNFLQNAGNFFKDPSVDAAIDYAKEHPLATAGMGYGAYQLLKPKEEKPPKDSPGLIRPYDFNREVRPDVFDMGAPMYAAAPGSSAERNYFNDTFTAQQPYFAPGPEYKRAAEGGVMGLAVGGPVETMSAMNAIGGNMQYPQAGLQTALYSNPMMQRPEAVNVISPGEGPAVGAYTGEQKFAGGGLSNLGGYSDGGRLLKGPGDGVSDSIPAVIGNRQPARLADGEFVVPARIVSEIGNGSTEAGARKLYAMMDRVQKARGKTVGKKKVAVNTRADKHLPA